MTYYIIVDGTKIKCEDYADMTTKFWMYKFSGRKVETEIHEAI